MNKGAVCARARLSAYREKRALFSKKEAPKRLGSLFTLVYIGEDSDCNLFKKDSEEFKKMDMDYEHFVTFMKECLVVKRRYPMILAYVKFLDALDLESSKHEIELFKKWLIRNPNIKNETMDQVDFKTGKTSITLCMNQFLTVPNFWSNLIQLENFLFDHQDKPQLSETDKLLDSLETDVMLSGLVQQIKHLVDNHHIDMSNPSDVLTNIQNIPGFDLILKDLIQNIQNGSFSPQHVVNTMNKIMAATEDNPDVVPTIKHTLKMVVGQLSDLVNQPNEETRQQLHHMMNNIIANSHTKDDLMSIIQYSIDEENKAAKNNS